MGWRRRGESKTLKLPTQEAIALMQRKLATRRTVRSLPQNTVNVKMLTSHYAIASGNSPRTTPSSHPVELRASSLNHQYKHHQWTPFVPQFPQPSIDLHYYPFRSTPRSLLDPHMRCSCTHVVLVTNEESINLIQCMDKVLVL